MRQANETYRRVYRYNAATMHEALRLSDTGLQNIQVAHELGIPRGSIGRLITIARQAQAQEPPDESQELAGEPHAPVEAVEMPESFVAFFNWLSRRVIAAEDALQETQKLLADKVGEANRAWAELNAQAKTDISRELAAVYQEYTRADRS